MAAGRVVTTDRVYGILYVRVYCAYLYAHADDDAGAARREGPGTAECNEPQPFGRARRVTIP